MWFLGCVKGPVCRIEWPLAVRLHIATASVKEKIQAAAKLVKNTKGPIWSQYLGCPFWATIETWQLNIADSPRPALSVDRKVSF